MGASSSSSTDVVVAGDGEAREVQVVDIIKSLNRHVLVLRDLSEYLNGLHHVGILYLPVLQRTIVLCGESHSTDCGRSDGKFIGDWVQRLVERCDADAPMVHIGVEESYSARYDYVAVGAGRPPHTMSGGDGGSALSSMHKFIDRRRLAKRGEYSADEAKKILTHCSRVHTHALDIRNRGIMNILGTLHRHRGIDDELSKQLLNDLSGGILDDYNRLNKLLRRTVGKLPAHDGIETASRATIIAALDLISTSEAMRIHLDKFYLMANLHDFWSTTTETPSDINGEMQWTMSRMMDMYTLARLLGPSMNDISVIIAGAEHTTIMESILLGLNHTHTERIRILNSPDADHGARFDPVELAWCTSLVSVDKTDAPVAITAETCGMMRTAVKRTLMDIFTKFKLLTVEERA